jgi:hypothetical protein
LPIKQPSSEWKMLSCLTLNEWCWSTLSPSMGIIINPRFLRHETFRDLVKQENCFVKNQPATAASISLLPLRIWRVLVYMAQPSRAKRGCSTEVGSVLIAYFASALRASSTLVCLIHRHFTASC